MQLKAIATLTVICLDACVCKATREHDLSRTGLETRAPLPSIALWSEHRGYHGIPPERPQLVFAAWDDGIVLSRQQGIVLPFKIEPQAVRDLLGTMKDIGVVDGQSFRVSRSEGRSSTIVVCYGKSFNVIQLDGPPAIWNYPWLETEAAEKRTAVALWNQAIETIKGVTNELARNQPLQLNERVLRGYDFSADGVAPWIGSVNVWEENCMPR